MRGFPGTVAVTAWQHHADPEKRNDKGRGEENLQEIDELCFKPFAVLWTNRMLMPPGRQPFT